MADEIIDIKVSELPQAITLDNLEILGIDRSTNKSVRALMSLLRGLDGKNIELQKTLTHIQWRIAGGSWTNLVALEELKGVKGDPGNPVEFQKSATHVQWRVQGTTTWNNLITLDELKGDIGQGLPVGGVTGQQLMKKSNTDYDYGWQTPAGGGDMLRSVYDPSGEGEVNGIAILDEKGKVPFSQLPIPIEMMSYGIEFDTAISSPSCARIGNTMLHKTLPIHNRMRGCLLDDDGNVTKYLGANDWTSETRDGSQGQVMIEIPAHYRRFETDGTKRRVFISEYNSSGFHLVPKMYVSAYEASVQRSTDKLCSVINMSTDYRGGGNNAGYDGTYRTFLGRPVTVKSRTQFRDAARKRNASATAEWNCMTYDAQKTLYWLFAIEYATLNSQAPYNAQLTTEGFRQGGLGNGVTTLTSSEWNSFNGYYPFTPCGHTDNLGNSTGVADYLVENDDKSISRIVSVPRYRGIENPFGNIWQWTDGINVQILPGDGLSKVFVCSDPAKFKDNGYDGYSHVGNEARNEGYVKELIFGEYGEIMPAIVGGGSTTYFCDYHYTNIPASETLRGVLFGGTADNGAGAGFVYATSGYPPSHTVANFGSRLCFLPV